MCSIFCPCHLFAGLKVQSKGEFTRTFNQPEDCTFTHCLRRTFTICSRYLRQSACGFDVFSMYFPPKYTETKLVSNKKCLSACHTDNQNNNFQELTTLLTAYTNYP